MPLELVKILARCRIPQAHRAVEPRRGQELAVGRQGNAGNATVMTFKSAYHFSGRGFVQEYGLLARERERAAVGTEGESGDFSSESIRACVAETMKQTARVQVP